MHRTFPLFLRALGVSLFCALLFAACAPSPTGGDADPEARFAALDVNQDGRLSGTEVDDSRRAYDRDGDGEVTRDEFLAGHAEPTSDTVDASPRPASSDDAASPAPTATPAAEAAPDAATDTDTAADRDASAERPAAPAPAAAKATGGTGLPVGAYQCMDTYTALGEGTRVSYKEVLVIEDADTYRFRRNGPTGQYRFDPATGVVEWLSGPYSGGNPTGSFTKRDGVDVITLTYTFDKLGTDEDFCRRTE